MVNYQKNYRIPINAENIKLRKTKAVFGRLYPTEYFKLSNGILDYLHDKRSIRDFFLQWLCL